ncbi:mucin-2-like isoform X2 [Saccostrea echinata]|uniref:mucin-2-like isoform X2 n=1 Tax=Saccostrea echinata TaxID=191078 RepID=UPI002A8116F9|nr:mucin-2-like isoform X2 [Saccostrea echinata]
MTTSALLSSFSLTGSPTTTLQTAQNFSAGGLLTPSSDILLTSAVSTTTVSSSMLSSLDISETLSLISASSNTEVLTSSTMVISTKHVSSGTPSSTVGPTENTTLTPSSTAVFSSLQVSSEIPSSTIGSTENLTSTMVFSTTQISSETLSSTVSSIQNLTPTAVFSTSQMISENPSSALGSTENVNSTLSSSTLKMSTSVFSAMEMLTTYLYTSQVNSDFQSSLTANVSSVPSISHSLVSTVVTTHSPTSFESSMLTTPQTASSFIATSTDVSLVTTPLLNTSSETVQITVTPSSEFTTTTNNVSSTVELSSAPSTLIPNTSVTAVTTSNLGTSELLPSMMSNLSTPVLSAISSEPIFATISQTIEPSSSVNVSMVEQTTQQATMSMSSFPALTVFQTESMVTGILESSSVLSNLSKTEIATSFTVMVSTRNMSETTISPTSFIMSSALTASLLGMSSLYVSTDFGNGSTVLMSSTASSMIEHSVSISSSENVSSGVVSTSFILSSGQSTMMPFLNGSLQPSVEIKTSSSSTEFSSEFFLSTSSIPEINVSSTAVWSNYTEQVTGGLFTSTIAPDLSSSYSTIDISNSSTVHPIVSTISTELIYNSTYSPTITNIETVTPSMPSSLASSPVITSMINSSILNSDSMSTILIISEVLTNSTIAVPTSSSQMSSGVMSELLSSTGILSTSSTNMVSESTAGVSPNLSSLVMDQSSQLVPDLSSLYTAQSSPQNTMVSSQTSNFFSSVSSTFAAVTTGVQSMTFVVSSTIPSNTEVVSSTIPSITQVASSSLQSTTQIESTSLQSTLPTVPDTFLTSLFSSPPLVTVTPVSSVEVTSSTIQAALSTVSTPHTSSVITTSSVNVLNSSQAAVSISSTPEVSLTTTVSATPDISPTPSSPSVTSLVTSTISSTPTPGQSVTPSPASTSQIPDASSVQTSISGVSTLVMEASQLVSSVNSTVSTTDMVSTVSATINITTTLIPSSTEMQMNMTSSELPSSTVTVSSSVVTGNITEGSTTTEVPSTTTTTTTTTPTTPSPTTTVNVRTFWVVTVLKIPMTEDITNKTFILSMEVKIATAYLKAFERQKQIAEGTYQPLRRKRAAQVQDTVVEIANATRTQGTGNVTFVYTITKNGTQVRSEEAVRTLGLLSDQEMALKLGYVVAEKASTYYGRNSGGAAPEEANNLWVVGVAVSAVVLVIIVIWVIFCFIIKKRGPESLKEGEPAQLLKMKGGTKDDESVEMVQSPSTSTQNVKKRQSYEVTKGEDMEDPTYATVKKPGKKPAREDSTAGESATLASDDTGLIPSPSKRGKRKKKRKPPSEDFDNIERETHLGSSAPPQPSREYKPMSLEDETEYQRKVAEERRKNKKRLREKRRREGQKKEDTENMMKEYLAVQEELDNVLDAPLPEGEVPEVFRTSSKGSKKRRRKKAEGEKNEGFEAENLSDAKKRMHKLLDDAFSLISPQLDEKNQEEEKPEKKHEPMIVNPSYHGSRREGLTTWSPYRAADEVTLISMPKTVLVKPMRRGSTKEVPEDEVERKGHHSKRPAVNLPEPVPNTSYTTEPPKPIILRSLSKDKPSSKHSTDPKPYQHNGFGSTEESATDRLKSSYVSQSGSGRVKSANGDLTRKPPIQHQKPFKRTPEGEDMTDVVSKEIHPGETPENTITAVRNELQNIVHPTVVTVKSGGWTRNSSGGMADIA